MNLNLVIDASGIFYRSLYTIGNYGTKKNQKLLDSEESQGIFMRKLATDFSALIKSVDNVNRVVVCLDSSSWRKQVPIQDGGYKSGRKEKKEEESTVNWDSFFKLTQEFTDILGSRGYIISKVKDAEADDLLYLWSKKLNSQKEAVIMVTGDKDLHQVISLHPNGSWTVVLDPVANRRKVVLSEEIRKICHSTTETGEVDIFNPSSWTNDPGDVLLSLLDRNDAQIVDPVRIATMKVLLGDAGDSVPGIVHWLDKNKHGEEVTRSLTETKMVKALAELPEFTWRDLHRGEYIQGLTDALKKVTKIELSPESISDNIQRNIRLVVLDEEIIPVSIIERFNQTVEIIESSPVHLSRGAILEGTSWWTEQKQPFIPKGYDFKVDDESEDIFKEKETTSKEDEEALNKALEQFRKKDNKGSSALF